MSFSLKLLLGVAAVVVSVVAVPLIIIAWYDVHYECVSQHAEMRVHGGIGFKIPGSPIVITPGSGTYTAQVYDEWKKREQ